VNEDNVHEDNVHEKDTKRLRTWNEDDALKISKIHTDGFEAEQIWEQVRRVIDGVRKEVERDLETRNEREKEKERRSENEDDMAEESDLGEEGVDYEIEDIDDDENARPSDDDEIESVEEDGLEEDEEGIQDEQNEEDEEDIEDGDEDEDAEDESEEDVVATEYIQDPNGLNDGFFSIDEFNKQSAFLEQADNRGEDDGAASDEEDVDWAAYPTLLQTIIAPMKTKKNQEQESDEEDGPTFGNMDLDAPEGESDDDEEGSEDGEMDDMLDMGNSNEIRYKDFFAPPAQKANKNKKGRPHPHNFPAKKKIPEVEEDRSEADEAALERVHRDLFSEDEDEDEEKGSGEERTNIQNLSTHEKRQLALKKEIAALESTLVSKKPWALSGEASSSIRPINSLLEEDLEFERTGKPIPIITAEISQSLETLIKARIIAKNFDDIYRRRPDAASLDPSSTDRYNLSDAKNKKSLAQIYEDEHVASTSTAPASIPESERKMEIEISNLWSEIRSNLDSLSNYTMRPKAPTTNLEIRTDVSVSKIEDARPAISTSTGGEMGGVETAMLAPGEIYRSGTNIDKKSGEIAQGRQIVSKEERDREESKRSRKRAKERLKKRRENEEGQKIADGVSNKPTSKSKGEEDVKKTLKKAGVGIIGKKGELTDVDGRQFNQNGGGGDKGRGNAASYKL